MGRSGLTPLASTASTRAPSSRSSLRVLLGLEDDTAPIVALLYPTERAVFPGGAELCVEWKSSRHMAAHMVQLSLDDGRTYEDVSATLPGAARSYLFTLPNRATEHGRIKVTGQAEAGTRAFASSRTPFTIEQIEQNAGRVQLLLPLGGQILRAGELVNVRWRHPEPLTDIPTAAEAATPLHYELHLSLDGGETYSRVVAEIPGRIHGLRWRVPNKATQRGRLRVVAIGPGDERSWDNAASDFAIVPR